MHAPPHLPEPEPEPEPVPVRVPVPVLVVLLVLDSCAAHAPPPAARRATLVLAAEPRGALEPCGCQSDPLGDVSRLASLARGATLIAGGDPGPPPPIREEDAAAAEFMRRALDAAGAVAVDPPRVVRAGEVRLGVASTAAGVASVRGGADVVLAVVRGGADAARAAARWPGVDLVLQADGVGEGRDLPERVGDAWVLAPADELRRAVRVDLVLRGGRLADAGGPAARRAEAARLNERAAFLEERLKTWPDNDFARARRAEAADLRARAGRLTRDRFAPPEQGSYFVADLLPVRRALARDPAVAAIVDAYNERVRAIGERRARAETPVLPEPGRPTYVGAAACARCHPTAAAKWRATPHAHAMATLADARKEFHPSCVGCHVTGFHRPGGATLAAGALADVGCESCHGPGSAHVAASGLDDPPTVARAVPESTCRTCHTPEHSDTFEFAAYLRDILDGDPARAHGADARARLGDGPTGHELRAAALARAKAMP